MILIKDSEFIRGNCPMTKEDIRALAIWKMNLNDNSTVLDVGSGSGSISVQASKLVPKGYVYAIERDDEAYNISKKNIEKFNCLNTVLIKGEASEILRDYISNGKKFDSIFIGGSGGNLVKIVNQCSKLLNENGTIVMNFITLDNAYKGVEEVKKLNYKVDISMVNISKNKGQSYMMIANNPIYIIQATKI
ncbi:Probable cobalt-precorrin-6Y C(15)-methyltransferase [decarboxylating] [uncultured Clostridium sp.]|uniref:precorrin-6Y C5,15-methyltransferase (decarboxylating) subunit CbiT n=1 Tax=uncultured Clostridium sp. TaxID=59620 RepID=UPI000822380A|nr:precorrin-6Y C5,15-methyltransferase (decarboxylating) subunit CbiT [uncultured Clostridium sp.]SCI83754.1 Probable cobalt-precorrin-6Y C(15)-methyltransferase [decarboxylating] [uncultured Clostridium sp.]